MMDRKILSAVLLAGNLLIAGSLFLYVYFIKGKGSSKSGKRVPDTGRIPGLLLEWILESAVFTAGILRLTGLIIAGIELPGAASRTLTGVWIFFSESMILLYLLWQARKGKKRVSGWGGIHDETEKAFRYSDICCEKENMLAMFLLLMLTLLIRKETNIPKAFALHLFFLLTALGLLYFRYSRENFSEKAFRERNSAMLSPGQQQNDYLKNVDIQYQKTRELWHDLKNHINVLEILAKEERLGELTDYLKSFRQDVEIRMLPMKTGCTAVDALLSDKLYHAGKAHIRVSVQLCDLSDTEIRYIDLCTVLGNLLDNAMEACKRLPRTDAAPFISLKLKEQEGFYYLTIINSAPEPVIQEGNYLSAKSGYDNVAGHGLGLRSVERIAHQYGGSMVTDYREGKFRVILRMENPVPG